MNPKKSLYILLFALSYQMPLWAQAGAPPTGAPATTPPAAPAELQKTPQKNPAPKAAPAARPPAAPPAKTAQPEGQTGGIAGGPETPGAGTTEASVNPEDIETKVEKEDQESIYSLILRGGWTMVGLGLIALIICALGLERAYTFYKQNLSTKGFFEELESGASDPGVLSRKLEGDERLIAKILAPALARHEAGRESFVRHVETSGSVELGKLERGLGLISNLGNLAPLLGFFGTVVGMRTSFLQFVEKAAPTARDLAGGVEEALITTAAGLLIAIPAYMLYYLFTYITDHFSVELERATAYLSDQMSGPASSEPSAAATRPVRLRKKGATSAEDQE